MFGFTKVLRNLGDDLGFANLTIGSCVVLFVLMLVTDPSEIGGGGLFSFLAPGFRSSFLFGATGTIPVLQFGRWWTILSAIWLHGGILHIGFNMMWAYQLVPPVARLYGASRTVILYIGAGAAGFLATILASFIPVLSVIPFLHPAELTLGASGAILGLLGALVFYGRRTGSSMVGRQAMSYALFLIVFGLVMARVDNWAHLGGFGGGYLIARWLDPLKPERTDHTILALALLGLSLLSILLSIVLGLPLIRQ